MVKIRGRSGVHHEVSEVLRDEKGKVKKIIQNYSTPVTIYNLVSLRAIAIDTECEKVTIRAPGFSEEEYYGFDKKS